MPKAVSSSESVPTVRVPLNTKRAYYTMGLVSDRATYTFLTKYGYVYPASEFENEGRYTYTLSCRVNEKIEKEIASYQNVLNMELFEGYTFKSPIKEREIDDQPVQFINIKLKRELKNPNKWMFQGELPEEDEDCILRLLPRIYVSSESKEIGVYFELKAVEK